MHKIIFWFLAKNLKKKLAFIYWWCKTFSPVNTVDGFNIDATKFFFNWFLRWKLCLPFFSSRNFELIDNYLFFFFLRSALFCVSSSDCSPVAAVLYCFPNTFAGLAWQLCITLTCRLLCKYCGWLHILASGSAFWKYNLARKNK